MVALVMEARRTDYALSQVRETMTVGELIDFLSQYDEDTPVYTSQDDGYTYGGIGWNSFREEDDTGED